MLPHSARTRTCLALLLVTIPSLRAYGLKGDDGSGPGLLVFPNLPLSNGQLAVYQDFVTAQTHNDILFRDGRTPSRPLLGDHLGNQITLAGSNRYLSDVILYFDLNTNFNTAPTPSEDLYTAELFKNDGPGSAPGTRIATSYTFAFNSGGSSIAVY